MMYSLGPALIRVSVLPCPDPSYHSSQHAACSTFPLDSSVKAESWSNHEKVTCSEMGTHKQQTIISVKRSGSNNYWIYLKTWQDTNLINRNEYDRNCAQTGTWTTCFPIILFNCKKYFPPTTQNYSIKILICSILLLSRLLCGKHDVSF